MKTFLILFIIGIIVSEIFFIISGIVKEDSSTDSVSDLIRDLFILDEGSKLIYYIIYAIFIPISVFPVLKKKITQRWLNLYAFIGGLTFHYAVSQVIAFLSKLQY